MPQPPATASATAAAAASPMPGGGAPILAAWLLVRRRAFLTFAKRRYVVITDDHVLLVDNTPVLHLVDCRVTTHPSSKVIDLTPAAHAGLPVRIFADSPFQYSKWRLALQTTSHAAIHHFYRIDTHNLVGVGVHGLVRAAVPYHPPRDHSHSAVDSASHPPSSSDFSHAAPASHPNNGSNNNDTENNDDGPGVHTQHDQLHRLSGSADNLILPATTAAAAAAAAAAQQHQQSPPHRSVGANPRAANNKLYSDRLRVDTAPPLPPLAPAALTPTTSTVTATSTPNTPTQSVPLPASLLGPSSSHDFDDVPAPPPAATVPLPSHLASLSSPATPTHVTAPPTPSATPPPPFPRSHNHHLSASTATTSSSGAFLPPSQPPLPPPPLHPTPSSSSSAAATIGGNPAQNNPASSSASTATNTPRESRDRNRDRSHDFAHARRLFKRRTASSPAVDRTSVDIDPDERAAVSPADVSVPASSTDKRYLRQPTGFHHSHTRSAHKHALHTPKQGPSPRASLIRLGRSKHSSVGRHQTQPHQQPQQHNHHFNGAAETDDDNDDATPPRIVPPPPQARERHPKLQQQQQQQQQQNYEGEIRQTSTQSHNAYHVHLDSREKEPSLDSTASSVRGGGGAGSAMRHQQQGPGRLSAHRVPLHTQLATHAQPMSSTTGTSSSHHRLPVAVKTISRTGHGSVTVASELLFAKARLNHFAIVKVVDLFQSVADVHVVMEYCAGGSLGHYIQEHGPLPDLDARQVFAPILKAVGYLHASGLVHWDVNPGNILFAAATGPFEPKLIDFGTARPIDPANGRVPQQYPVFSEKGKVASLACASPELLTSKAHRYAAKADMWQLGCVLYFVMVGKLPFSRRLQEQSHTQKQQQQQANPHEIGVSATIMEFCKKRTPERRAFLFEREATGDVNVGDAAEELIMKLLCPNPRMRPNALQCLKEFAFLAPGK